MGMEKTNQVKPIISKIWNKHARVKCGGGKHAIFQLTVRRIRMFFSLKPSQSQGESSLKISGRGICRFGGDREHKTHTNSLTE